MHIPKLVAMAVALAPLASASPSSIFSSDVQNFNVTDFVNNVDLDVTGHMLAKRASAGTDVCRHAYRFFWESWIIQVPKAWWYTKWKGDAGMAREAMDRYLKSAGICGIKPTKFRVFESGKKEGWIEAKFTTCIGPNESRFVSMFPILFDVHAEDHELVCRSGFPK